MGHPALTYQLRGICQVDVEVRCLEQPVHSGFWGGPVPDAVRILARLVADLEKPDGSLNVPGLYRSVAKTGARQLRRIRSLPFDEAKFRALGGDEARHPPRRREGLLGVGAALDAARPHRDRPRGAPHPGLLEPDHRLGAGAALAAHRAGHGRLEGRRAAREEAHRPPAGGGEGDGPGHAATSRWWTTDPEGPAFEAARRALRKGYGRDAAMIGAGGSIGFVKPFSDALGGVPCLLMGVEDPASAIHSENESLHLGDFRKAIRAAVHLYDELSRTPLARG